ncbi:MAG: amidohydrolase family protein [Anaerolineae bacterium]|nr:amidohydrolase family protein [Thermoflexales bacterium]MDW8408587.1 amidohydrolase family protein [Anaerolineae bacterium]
MAAQIVLSSWLIRSADELPLPDHAVLIDNGRVVASGPNADMLAAHPQARVTDLRDKAVSPAFVDAHRHCYGVLAHGIPTENAPADFWAFLNDFWWGKIEDRLDHAMLRAAMDLACYDMIYSGVTTFFDCLEAPNAIPGGLFVQAEVVQRWGLRGMLCFEATERVSRENGELGLRENVEFITYCNSQRTTRTQNSSIQGQHLQAEKDVMPASASAPALLWGAMCHHTTFTCSDDFIRRAHALAREHHALLHFHCAEGTYEPEQCVKRYGHRTIEHYEALGVLDETTMASQCVQLSPREVEIVGRRGIRVTTMPLSNCEVGGGIAPVPEMRAAGATVGLGTDGYVANHFASLRGAFLIHKARLCDPRAMPGNVVWRMATLEAAQTMRLTEQSAAPVGALWPGYSADLIAIDLDLPTPVTAHNLFDQLILWRDATHVDSVMCAGRWLKRDHVVLNAEPGRLLARVREHAERLWRMG